MKRSAVLFVALALAPSLAHAADSDRRPHLWTVPEIAREIPGSSRLDTHVATSGKVEYRKTEKDGDLHLRLCDQGSCIVLECIPEIPEVAASCKKARKGSRLKAWGISRYDYAHGWWELHPALGVEAVR
jgi:hypothetical protein